MVDVKKLKDGDVLFFVYDNENAICTGKILKRSHKATEFVSFCKTIRFKVKGNESMLFTSLEKAKDYFFNKTKKTECGNSKLKEEDCLTSKENLPDVELCLDSDDTAEDVLNYLKKMHIGQDGCVVSVTFTDGDVIFVPIFPGGMIGVICDSCSEARGFICGVHFMKTVYCNVVKESYNQINKLLNN